MIRHGILTCNHLASSWRECGRARLYRDLLKRAAKFHGGFDVVYSYWSDASAHGAALYARRHSETRIVSRAHSADVFEERHPQGYAALKRQLLPEMDRVFAIAETVRDYLISRYDLPAHLVTVEPLGVSVPAAPPRPDGHGIRLLSISFCVPEKRIDKLIHAVALTAQSAPDRDVQWTHIGGGPLYAETKQFAETILGQIPNLTWHMPGTLTHEETTGMLDQSPFDLIINTSDIEGVPVSIMEAMARGIPAVATETGGTPELVREPIGRIIPKSASPDTISQAVLEFLPEALSPEVRIETRRRIIDRYDGETNYPRFIEELTGHTCTVGRTSSAPPQ